MLPDRTTNFSLTFFLSAPDLIFRIAFRRQSELDSKTNGLDGLMIHLSRAVDIVQ